MEAKEANINLCNTLFSGLSQKNVPFIAYPFNKYTNRQTTQGSELLLCILK